MALKNRLRTILTEQNISQSQLCEAVGINKSTLSNIINCKQNPTIIDALDIAKYLEVPVEKIFYRENTDMEELSESFKQVVITTVGELYLFNSVNTKTKLNLSKLYKSLIDSFIEEENISPNIIPTLYAYCLHKSGCEEVNKIAQEVISSYK